VEIAAEPQKETKSVPSKRYIEVENLQSGQPRPYADHEFVDVLTFTRDDGRRPEWLDKNGLPQIVPYYVDQHFAFAIAKQFCSFVEKGDPNANWASRFLVSFDRLPPTPPSQSDFQVREDSSDKWKIHVRSLFTD
jgi:hypothetical protein